MRRLTLLLAGLAALSCSGSPRQESMAELRGRVIERARVQTVYMDSLLNERQAPGTDWQGPRTFQDGKLLTTGVSGWVSGFYPGVLWQVYEATEDTLFRSLATKYTKPLAALLVRDTDHDIGFQLMSSYGRWLDSGPADANTAEALREVLREGAGTLAGRFDPEIGVIRSWNGDHWNYPVIIDNMMNLELLMKYGDRAIAEKHALTTAANHFREDGTTWHLVNYADDGSVLGKQTVQGYADDSAWARGQSWALYGYAMMAREERAAGNEELAGTFYGIADKLKGWLLAHLPEDGIPCWDYSQTDYRDASAGAILASGLLILNELKPDETALQTADRILRTLASPEYLADPRTNGGFLLKHSVGNLPGGSEIDVPLTYADYYFLEALSRFPR